MGIGLSLFLIAVGAVLTFAVNVPATGIDIDAVGVILMGVGLGVLVYTLMWWGDQAPGRRTHTIVHHRDSDPALRPDDAYTRRVIEYERRVS